MRLGKTLELLEEAVAASNLVQAANLIDLCSTYVGVYLKKDKRDEYEGLPGFSYGDKRTHGQVFKDLRGRLAWILDTAAANKCFAYLDGEVGDASALDEDKEE